MAAARVFVSVGIALLAIFVVLAEGGECPQIIDGDYYGNDIGSSSCPTFEECCDRCVANSKCFAWTFKIDDGVCYQKSTAGNFRYLKGATSGHVLRPVPDLSFYIVYNESDPHSNCANQAAAPGKSDKFGDICVYKEPIYDWQKKRQIGTDVVQISTWQSFDESGFYGVAPSNYFFGPPDDGHTSSILVYGAKLNGYVENAIIGGTGQYRGVKGYVITPNSGECSDDKSVCYFPKNVYFTSECALMDSTSMNH